MDWKTTYIEILVYYKKWKVGTKNMLNFNKKSYEQEKKELEELYAKIDYDTFDNDYQDDTDIEYLDAPYSQYYADWLQGNRGWMIMKVLEKHTRLIVAVLVLVIVMLSIALWNSCYINKLDDYYFKEYLNSADELEH